MHTWQIKEYRIAFATSSFKMTFAPVCVCVWRGTGEAPGFVYYIRWMCVWITWEMCSWVVIWFRTVFIFHAVFFLLLSVWSLRLCVCGLFFDCDRMAHFAYASPHSLSTYGNVMRCDVLWCVWYIWSHCQIEIKLYCDIILNGYAIRRVSFTYRTHFFFTPKNPNDNGLWNMHQIGNEAWAATNGTEATIRIPS